MGITAPFERGEIGPDLFARHAASNLRALCLNIAIGRIAAACKSSGSRSKTQPSCDKSGTMTVWIYDQGEDLNVLALTLRQDYGHAHNARLIRLAGSRDGR
jgi:hypothetical protein